MDFVAILNNSEWMSHEFLHCYGNTKPSLWFGNCSHSADHSWADSEGPVFYITCNCICLGFCCFPGFFFLWFHVPLSPHNHPVLFQIPIYCCSSFKYTFTNVGCNIVPYFQYSVVVCFTEELFGKKHVTVRESVPAVIAALIGFQVLDLKGKREKEKLSIRLPWS